MTSLCLTRAGAAVHVLNPLLAPRLQSTANALHEHKTDHIDVARLCEIGRLYVADLDRFRYQPDPARARPCSKPPSAPSLETGETRPIKKV
jgi:hypothetical protein